MNNTATVITLVARSRQLLSKIEADLTSQKFKFNPLRLHEMSSTTLARMQATEGYFYSTTIWRKGRYHLLLLIYKNANGVWTSEYTCEQCRP